MELTEAEQRLVDAAKKGEVADYSAQAPDDNDPAKGHKWDDSRTVRADTIYRLLTGSKPEWALHAKGVLVRGARVKGRLDFAAAEIKSPFFLDRCFLDEAIILIDASARSIVLTGSYVPGIQADHLTLNGSLFLSQDFNVQGVVSLVGAKIDGHLLCRGGIFEKGLRADFLKVGSVFLDQGFKAKGVVSLLGAEIDGQLAATRGTFEKGLNAEGLKVADVFFNEGFNAKDEVNLVGAKIDGQLVCTGGTFEKGLSASTLKVGSIGLNEGFNAGGVVNLVGAEIDGSLVCTRGVFQSDLRANGLRVGTVGFDDGFNAKGEVSLVGAKIDGWLICTRGSFEKVLNADTLKVGSVFFNQGFNAKGIVSLVEAKIDGALVCTYGTFEDTLKGDGLKAVDVALNEGFNAKGVVSLVGAEIDGQLICEGGTFENALHADRLKVGGVFLNKGFKAKGVVRLVGAEIGGQLLCSGGTFENGLLADTLKVGDVFLDKGFIAKGDVRLVRAKIDSHLICAGGVFEGCLNLRNANAGAIVDEPKSWPKPNKLLLDGFEYTISSNRGVPRTVRERLKWIELGPNEPNDPFLPQPYEQLVKVLHAMGDDAGARKVSIEERWALRRRGKIGFAAWLWNWILFLLAGYGYRAWLPLLWAAGVIIAGGLIFQPAEFLRVTDGKVPAAASIPAAMPQTPAAQIVVPQKTPVQIEKTELPHPFLFSIDVFLPFADLNQKKTWQLDEGGRGFLVYQFWYLFEELAGWVLTGLLAAAATGLLKNQ